MTAAQKTQKKKTPDKAAVKKKLDRLKDLYVDGLIDKETYLADREKLLSKLPDEPQQKNLSPVRSMVLSGDFLEHYGILSREEKRLLWRSLIDHMEADAEGDIRLFF